MKYVYMLRAGNDHYKVGVAINVLRRVANIQTSNANHISVVTAKLVNDPYGVERNVHNFLKNTKAGGGNEWFRLDPEDAINVAIMINDNPEIDVYANVDLNKQLIEQTLRHKSLEKKLDILINTQQKKAILKNTGKENAGSDEVIIKTDDALIAEALVLIREHGKASTSMLQRWLSIGYGRAARVMDALESQGLISAADGSHPRHLIDKDIY
jgi:hypothetical protein